MAFALNRWHSTVASTFLEANAGLQYVFGDVSGALRSRMRYTQRQIDGLGTAKARRKKRPRPRSPLLEGKFFCTWPWSGASPLKAAAPLSRRGPQDCGTALIDVLAGFMYDSLVRASVLLSGVGAAFPRLGPPRAGLSAQGSRRGPSRRAPPRRS